MKKSLLSSKKLLNFHNVNGNGKYKTNFNNKKIYFNQFYFFKSKTKKGEKRIRREEKKEEQCFYIKKYFSLFFKNFNGGYGGRSPPNFGDAIFTPGSKKLPSAHAYYEFRLFLNKYQKTLP